MAPGTNATSTGLDANEGARLDGVVRHTGNVRSMNAQRRGVVMGNGGARTKTKSEATKAAANAVLRYATETLDERRGRVALAGAYLLHEDDPRSPAVGAALATVEAASAELAIIYADEDPSPHHALDALNSAEHALAALRVLLAELAR